MTDSCHPKGLSPVQLTEAAAERALELGFNAFGAAEARALVREADAFKAWLREGRHGEMGWLEREPERRTDPSLVLPNCRTVIVVALDYLQPDEADSRDEGVTGRVSRYARGRDYHRVMEKRLRKLARCIDDLAAPGVRSRPYVDHGPVMERQWAAQAGLGFLGKHTLLIRPDAGSWCFLGVILTTAELAPTPTPPRMTGCGDCTRCIEACPTGAITAPWEFDARRCISYLTIESPGPIPEDLWPRMDRWVYGCDACQEVCPYNLKRASPPAEDPLAPRNVPAEWSLADLIGMDEEALLIRLGSSPLKRAGADRLARNAAVVAAATGGEDEARVLRQRLARPPSDSESLATLERALQRIEDRSGSQRAETGGNRA